MTTTVQDLRDAIARVTSGTGNPDAWRAGLSADDLAVVPAAVIDPDVLTGLVNKIRAGHPVVFDPPASPAPADPAPADPAPADPASPGEQRGEAAAAMKAAEAALAQQNSSTAQLDLHVIGAILNAHTQTMDGGDRLRRLQRDVENAVRSRTDLDTPAGARDFQRYLIGKLREIGAVVETVNLDDTSKAALASAWTALYASGTTPVPGADAAPTRPVAVQPAEPRPAESLPPYGTDIATNSGPDPLLDALLAQPESSPAPVPPPVASAAPLAPAALPAAAAPMLPPPAASTGAGLPTMPGEGISLPQSPTGLGSSGLGGYSDEIPLDELLDEQYPLADETSAEPEPEPEPEPKSENETEETTVRLPDGSSVTAPTPEIAKVIKAVSDGTPIGEAFSKQGITIPPPGTAVAEPLNPARVRAGDVGMFTDRQALAVDPDRALLNGKIQPVADVSGPSFLGWLHPPAPGATTPSTQPAAPSPAGTPPPTRPAAGTDR